MKTYVDSLWMNCRDKATGLFTCLGTPELHLYEQSAVIQIMSLLAWEPENYKLIA